VQTGTYLGSAVILAGGSLDTKTKPHGNDTFYAKSLMTPERAPISDGAVRAFVEHLANEGFASKTLPPAVVRVLQIYRQRSEGGTSKVKSTRDRTGIKFNRTTDAYAVGTIKETCATGYIEERIAPSYRRAYAAELASRKSRL